MSPTELVAMVSTCEVDGCTGIASFGFVESGKYLTYCRDHLPTTDHKDRGTR